MKSGQKLTIVAGTSGYSITEGWTQEAGPNERHHHHFTTEAEVERFVGAALYPDAPVNDAGSER